MFTMPPLNSEQLEVAVAGTVFVLRVTYYFEVYMKFQFHTPLHVGNIIHSPPHERVVLVPRIVFSRTPLGALFSG